jgi:hypothetical protein
MEQHRQPKLAVRKFASRDGCRPTLPNGEEELHTVVER